MLATLAGGCFWCTEAVFDQLKGVNKVTPGYSGGHVANPSYEQVAMGETGHAESVQIDFEEKIISFETLLEVFFKLHDPTTLNRQGVDIGTEYRSAIFYLDEGQKEIAEKVIKKSQNDYRNTIVTEITKYTNFYEADEMHKDFYIKRKGSLYCTLVIDPKINKLKKNFSYLLAST